MLLEIAIFTLIMASIGVGLTIYEFKKMIKDEKKKKRKKGKIDKEF